MYRTHKYSVCHPICRQQHRDSRVQGAQSGFGELSERDYVVGPPVDVKKGHRQRTEQMEWEVDLIVLNVSALVSVQQKDPSSQVKCGRTSTQWGPPHVDF